MSVPRRDIFVVEKCVFYMKHNFFLLLIRRAVSFEELGLPAKLVKYEVLSQFHIASWIRLEILCKMKVSILNFVNSRPVS